MHAPRDVPPELASCYEYPLLDKDQEAHLFRKMNFLKFKAAKLRDEFRKKHKSEAEGYDALTKKIDKAKKDKEIDEVDAAVDAFESVVLDYLVQAKGQKTTEPKGKPSEVLVKRTIKPLLQLNDLCRNGGDEGKKDVDAMKALIAALEQGIGLGTQIDSSPVTVDGVTITNVEGGGCGTCNIAEALKRGVKAIEPSQAAQDEYVRQFESMEFPYEEFQSSCPPSYFNNEGDAGTKWFLFRQWGPGWYAFQDMLQAWRDKGDLEGMVVTK